MTQGYTQQVGLKPAAVIPSIPPPTAASSVVLSSVGASTITREISLYNSTDKILNEISQIIRDNIRLNFLTYHFTYY
jgi:hypothetical protein